MACEGTPPVRLRSCATQALNETRGFYYPQWIEVRGGEPGAGAPGLPA